MIEIIKNIFKKTDYFMLFILIALSAISLLTIYSTSYDSNTAWIKELPHKQLMFIIFGIIIYMILPFIGYRSLISLSIPFYIIGCIMLILVLKFGQGTTSGQGITVKRWLEIGFITIQPSEFFKVAWVLLMGWIFADLKPESLGLVDLLKKFIWVIPPTILVNKQPDMGTSLTFLAVWGIVVAYLGFKRYIFVLLVILAVVATPFAWTHMKDYQKMRVLSFLQPEKYEGKEAYQAKQSQIAIGSGGITGKGYLKGTQSHLQFMPAMRTDFIYSVINEEFGFLGGLAVIILFIFLIIRIIYTATQLREPRGKVMCIAVCGFIFLQAYLNIYMTIGIAPIVGIPLPFISYGGSSMISFFVMAALVNSAFITQREETRY